MNITDSREKILERIEYKLEEIGFSDQPGSILYSGNETLKKSDYYFLGANPGGHSDQDLGKFPDTVLNQLLRKNTTPSFNEYYDARWKNRGRNPSLPGQALLQRRIKYLFNELGIDLKDTLSTNLVFARSPTEQELPLNWLNAANKCWEIHKILLSVVEPKIIIAYGETAYEFLEKKMSIEFRDDTFPVHSENETKFFRYCRGILSLDEIELNPINLIATPHLSRYKIDAKGLDFRDKYDVRPAISWMKKNIRNAVIS